MTRKEATVRARSFGLDTRVIDLLVELKLLKFDPEPEQKPTAETIIRDTITNHYGARPFESHTRCAVKIINNLLKYNYQIIDADECGVIPKPTTVREFIRKVERTPFTFGEQDNACEQEEGA